MSITKLDDILDELPNLETDSFGAIGDIVKQKLYAIDNLGQPTTTQDAISTIQAYNLVTLWGLGQVVKRLTAIEEARDSHEN